MFDRCWALCASVLLIITCINPIRAAEYKEIFLFSSRGEGNEITQAFTVGDDKSFYGVTREGGGNRNDGKGTVFRLLKSGQKWNRQTLAVFRGSDRGRSDGAFPLSSPVFGQDGKLYGTTSEGGRKDCGIAYVLTPPTDDLSEGERKTIFQFAGGPDEPCVPSGKLLVQADGSIIGTSSAGGKSDGFGDSGTVWRLLPPARNDAEWTLSVLARLPNRITRIAALHPFGPDAFIGVAEGRFSAQSGLFKITRPDTTETLWNYEFIHEFKGGRNDGYGTATDIFVRPPREIYGVTRFGGRFTTSQCSRVEGDGCGVFYKVSLEGRTWTQEILYSFRSFRAEGQLLPHSPAAGIYRDPRKPDSFIGVSIFGGKADSGSIFRLSPPQGVEKEWALTALHSFSDFSDCCSKLTKSGKLLYGAFYSTDIVGDHIFAFDSSDTQQRSPFAEKAAQPK